MDEFINTVNNNDRETNIYWYLYIENYCPVCGRSTTNKERQYTLKPENYCDRHKFNEVYDYCEG